MNPHKSTSRIHKLPRRTVTASGHSRHLLIQRLREIDKLTAKELAVIMADAEKIKQAFHLHR